MGILAAVGHTPVAEHTLAEEEPELAVVEHNLVAVGEVHIQPVVVDNLVVRSLVDLLNR